MYRDFFCTVTYIGELIYNDTVLTARGFVQTSKYMLCILFCLGIGNHVFQANNWYNLFFFQHGTVATSSETSVGTQPGGSVTSRTASESLQVASTTSSHHTGAKFRHGLLQLMIHTIDPLHDGQYAGSATIKFFSIGVTKMVTFNTFCNCDRPEVVSYLACRLLLKYIANYHCRVNCIVKSSKLLEFLKTNFAYNCVIIVCMIVTLHDSNVKIMILMMHKNN